MVELNREQLLDELSNFEKKKSVSDIPDILNKYLESIAENGDTIFQWNKLQPLLRRKLELVMTEFNQKCPTDHLIPLPNVKQFDFNELKAQILEAIDDFPSAPFTIQRLCELITNPSKHYKRTDKFMRGIEKNILVVTTIEPKSAIGETTHYVSTSSFKNLFPSLHSSANSLQSSSSMSASTSLLVNGIADVICENQMAIHSSNEDLLSESKPNSCPVSPTSVPLSPNTNSPPSQHLPPLQQLDSFTTVFASSPSTPLSVVSDLHSYEQSSSLSLMSSNPCPKSPKESPSYTSTTNDAKDTQNAVKLESLSPTPHSQTDSSIISSSSNTSQVNTSINIDNNDIKEEESFIDKSLHDFKESEALDTNGIQNETKMNQELSESKDNNEKHNEIHKNDNNNKENSNNITNISCEQNNNPIASESEGFSMKPNNDSDNTTGGDIHLNEENKPLIEDLPNETHIEDQVIESANDQIRSRTDDVDMSTPMDFCGSNNSSNISDFNDKTSELIPDCNIMDDTLSQSEQSDQSEPMDED